MNEDLDTISIFTMQRCRWLESMNPSARKVTPNLWDRFRSLNDIPQDFPRFSTNTTNTFLFKADPGSIFFGFFKFFSSLLTEQLLPIMFDCQSDGPRQQIFDFGTEMQRHRLGEALLAAGTLFNDEHATQVLQKALQHAPQQVGMMVDRIKMMLMMVTRLWMMKNMTTDLGFNNYILLWCNEFAWAVNCFPFSS